MKFLIDAHLPRRIVTQLSQAGQDAIHTRDLTLGNRTSDSVINQISITEQRIVVTKDADFMGSHRYCQLNVLQMKWDAFAER